MKWTLYQGSEGREKNARGPLCAGPKKSPRIQDIFLKFFVRIGNTYPSWTMIPDFFYFMFLRVVFTEMLTNWPRKIWNFVGYQAMAQYHGEPCKIALHHQKVQFPGIKIPLHSLKNIENSGNGERFCKHRWNFAPQKLQIAIGNNGTQMAAGWARILHPSDPMKKYWT